MTSAQLRDRTSAATAGIGRKRAAKPCCSHAVTVWQIVASRPRAVILLQEYQ